MSLSTSRIAYTDCYTILDRAIGDPRGVRLRMDSLNSAIHLRMRLHQARKINRDDNAMTYSEQRDHPMFACSIYDPLAIRILAVGDQHYLYLEPYTIDEAIIEPLSEVEPSLPPPTPVQMIEPPKQVLQIEHIRRRV